MANIFEKFINGLNGSAISEQEKFVIVQDAQMTLISRAGGDDFAGPWIDANGPRFRELIEDPQNNFIERLSDESTRSAALDEIQSRLYH